MAASETTVSACPNETQRDGGALRTIQRFACGFGGPEVRNARAHHQPQARRFSFKSVEFHEFTEYRAGSGSL